MDPNLAGRRAELVNCYEFRKVSSIARAQHKHTSLETSGKLQARTSPYLSVTQQLGAQTEIQQLRAQNQKPRAKSRHNEASLPPPLPFQNNFPPTQNYFQSHLIFPCTPTPLALAAPPPPPSPPTQPNPISTLQGPPSNPTLRRREANRSGSNVLLPVDPGEEEPAGHGVDRRAPRAQG
jgi:hypothetical protein